MLQLGELFIQLVARLGGDRPGLCLGVGETGFVSRFGFFGLALEVRGLVEIVRNAVAPFLDRAAEPRQHERRHDRVETAEGHDEPENLARIARGVELRHAAGALRSLMGGGGGLCCGADEHH